MKPDHIPRPYRFPGKDKDDRPASIRREVVSCYIGPCLATLWLKWPRGCRGGKEGHSDDRQPPRDDHSMHSSVIVLSTSSAHIQSSIPDRGMLGNGELATSIGWSDFLIPITNNSLFYTLQQRKVGIRVKR